MVRNQVHVENPKRLPLPAEVEAILKRTFATHQRVVIKAELGSGFSGSRVFLVHPIQDAPELPAVVKIAPAALIEREYQAYQKHIHNKLSGAAEIRNEPISLPGSDWAGLCYRLVGSGIFEIESLNSFCRHASVKDIWHVLEKRLFKRIAPLWQFSHTSPQFNLQASYDRLLPVNLLLGPTALPTSVLHQPLSPDTVDERSFKQGDYVRLEGFVVTEVDPDNRTVTLNLPASPNGLFVSYRVRLQPVDVPSSYRVSDVIDSVECVVTATRDDLLRTYARRALGLDLLDAVTAETLTLSGSTDTVLPNPLVVLADILNEPRHVRVAYVHGDLNMENILVAPDTRDVRLIDFAMARQDHVLHDLLRLETGVVTWLLPEALAEARLPAETIYRLYEQLHWAARSTGYFSVPEKLHPAMRKAFVMLATIRKMARGCLFAPDDWGEYYRGLTLYLLGALKFKNLDDVPQAPLPKQVAFWGAASAQWLLQERSLLEDTSWQPLTSILDDLTGQTLGQYEIGELIGKGSMSVVYRARQSRLKRDVAVKVMAPTLAADPTFRQRFEHEAQAIANLRHPNILTVHDYGETEDDQLYLVVDYVRGGTLREWLVSLVSTLPALEKAIEIIVQMAKALDYAHLQGIVHRDVKPNNILLTLDGRPLLADFGLVKSVQDDRRLTANGVMLGTPDYVAPEQAQGADVDSRADVYALGVILFEILTGRHPYVSETPISVIIKHISEPMPRPSEINPALSVMLDQIVARATAKKPAERYQRAADMARDLRTVLASGVMAQQSASVSVEAETLAIELPPFIAGPPIAHPSQFFGRERELRRLFNLWKRTPLQNAAIIGPRRSGKTSLLLYLKSITTTPLSHLRTGQRADWLPDPERYCWAFVDFQDSRMHSQEELLRYLLSSLNLPAGNAVDSKRIPCDLDYFMDVVSRDLRTPTVILLDEIDVALQRCPELDTSFWESLRSLATNHVRGNLGFVLAAHESPGVLAEHSNIGSPFFNIFGYTTTLGPLAEQEARELIAGSPVPFSPADVDWILSASGRWPMLLQILCRERLIALEEGETDDVWQEDGRRQMAPFRDLLEE
ncbi:MAG: protein kinase [Chloroflexi bacterium]|nr:protein kinase [Chloroflexota bacterium]